MKDTCVVLSFFSPCGYELPRRHFHTVLNTLHATGVPLVVTQAVFNSQEPERIPSCIPSKVYSTKSYLFYKENLWNLATELTDAKKLIFIDADIIFNNTNWVERSSELLEHCDVMQPFTNAIWHDEEGRASAVKNCSAYAIKMKRPPQLGRYHPGFAWGFRREAFEAFGGWYDLIATGNTDGAFSFCFNDDEGTQGLLKWFSNNQDPVVGSPDFKLYRRKVLALGLRVDYLKSSSVVHLWHGNPSDRQYISRKDLFSRNEDNSYPVHKRKDGLLMWDNEELSNVGPKKYFLDKKDDG